jgi:glycine betaine catabolism B
MTAASSPRFIKVLVLINALVPALMLGIDTWRGNLGANGINYAIHTTGLLALLCMTLSLMITPAMRLTKWRVLVASRRPLGVMAFLYLLAHFTMFFALDRAGDVGDTLNEIISRQYLQIGTAALLLMLPLALTSTDAMVTRLGAKRWKLLHRLAYLAAIGGVTHYWLLVKSDTRQPKVFAIVLTGLLVFRIVAHYADLRVTVARALMRGKTVRNADIVKKKFWRGELRVAGIFQETATVKTFRMMMPNGGPLPFDYLPGQYLGITLQINGKRVPRSYTISSSPTRTGTIEITVRRAANGYASHFLHDHIKTGDLLTIAAPAGKFVFTGADDKEVLLIAGGVGVTPLMGIIRYLTDRCWTGDIYLVFSVRQPTEVIFAAELHSLQARFPNLHVHITVADGDVKDLLNWTGGRGRISAELIRSLVENVATAPVYICGPQPMMDAAHAMARDLGVPGERIHVEAFVSPVTSDVTGDDPDAEPTSPAASGGDALFQIRFAGSAIEGEGGTDLTVLEAAEECGVAIPFECRSGVCGQCKTKLLSGRVTMDATDALTKADRANGLILACQARPVTAIKVDA